MIVNVQFFATGNLATGNMVGDKSPFHSLTTRVGQFSMNVIACLRQLLLHRRGLSDADSCQFPTHFHTEDAIGNEAKN
jgi:hypothetical protein